MMIVMKFELVSLQLVEKGGVVVVIDWKCITCVCDIFSEAPLKKIYMMLPISFWGYDVSTYAPSSGSSQNYRPATFPFHAAVFIHLKSLFAACFVYIFCMVHMFACAGASVCVCVCVCACACVCACETCLE